MYTALYLSVKSQVNVHKISWKISNLGLSPFEINKFRAQKLKQSRTVEGKSIEDIYR